MKTPPLPQFATDDEAQVFVDTEDLSRFDLKGGTTIQYEFQVKTATLHQGRPQQLSEGETAAMRRPE